MLQGATRAALKSRMRLRSRRLPTSVLDTVHRLGNKRQPSSITRPRAIILQFISRLGRDAVWKAGKDSPYMKEHGLQFKEDLSKGDKERRLRLLPEIQKARAAGTVAYYAGARAFIQG